jgi:hypothetical protein
LDMDEGYETIIGDQYVTFFVATRPDT